MNNAVKMFIAATVVAVATYYALDFAFPRQDEASIAAAESAAASGAVAKQEAPAAVTPEEAALAPAEGAAILETPEATATEEAPEETAEAPAETAPAEDDVLAVEEEEVIEDLTLPEPEQEAAPAPKPAPAAVAPAAKAQAAAPAAAKPSTPKVDATAQPWWGQGDGSSLSLVYAGSAAYKRAIVLMFNSEFANAESAGRALRVTTADGKAVSGRWELNANNARMLVFPVANAGNYTVRVAGDLSDKSGRKLGGALQGPVRIP